MDSTERGLLMRATSSLAEEELRREHDRYRQIAEESARREVERRAEDKRRKETMALPCTRCHREGQPKNAEGMCFECVGLIERASKLAPLFAQAGIAATTQELEMILPVLEDHFSHDSW